jgi:hypothetical protein
VLCDVYEFFFWITVELNLVGEVTYFMEVILIRTIVRNDVGEVTS